MSVPFGELRTNTDRAYEVSAVRRVERDESAQEFGQKNRDGRKPGKHSPEETPAEATPQDIVELSSHPSAISPPDLSGVPLSTALAVVKVAPPARKGKSVPAPAPPDRHIDIKV